jgi:hypothetical protein
MMLYAQPYDCTKTGFYFNDLEQYEERASGIEYELQRIECEDYPFEPGQGNIELFFQLIDELTLDELVKCRFLICQGYGVGQLRDELDNWQGFQGTLTEYVEEIIEDMDLPQSLARYFDADKYKRDLECEGFYTEFEGYVFYVG